MEGVFYFVIFWFDFKGCYIFFEDVGVWWFVNDCFFVFVEFLFEGVLDFDQELIFDFNDELVIVWVVSNC